MAKPERWHQDAESETRQELKASGPVLSGLTVPMSWCSVCPLLLSQQHPRCHTTLARPSRHSGLNPDSAASTQLFQMLEWSDEYFST